MYWWAGRESNPHSRRRLIYSQRSSPPAQPTHVRRRRRTETAVSWWARRPMDWRWSRRRDSNPEPAVYKTAALPIELRRRDRQGHTADDPIRRREMIGPPGVMGQAWVRPSRRHRRLRRVVRDVGRQQRVKRAPNRAWQRTATRHATRRAEDRTSCCSRFGVDCQSRCSAVARRACSRRSWRGGWRCARDAGRPPRTVHGPRVGPTRVGRTPRGSLCWPGGGWPGLGSIGLAWRGFGRGGLGRRNHVQLCRRNLRSLGRVGRRLHGFAVIGRRCRRLGGATGRRPGVGRASRPKAAGAPRDRAGRRPRRAGSNPATAALSEPTAPRIGIRMSRSQRRRTAGPRPCPSLPTTIASGPRRSVWRAVSGASASEPTIRRPSTVQIGERAGQVVDRAEQQVLDGAGRRLDRGRGERRLAAGREDHAVDAGRLGAPQERADVLGILERVEDEDERRLGALDGPGEDVVERREPARLDDEGDALVAVEAGQRRERAALDLDDRDAQARRRGARASRAARGAAGTTSRRRAGRPAANASSTGRRPATSSSSGPSRSGARQRRTAGRGQSRGSGRWPAHERSGDGGPAASGGRRPSTAPWRAVRPAGRSVVDVRRTAAARTGRRWADGHRAGWPERGTGSTGGWTAAIEGTLGHGAPRIASGRHSIARHARDRGRPACRDPGRLAAGDRRTAEDEGAEVRAGRSRPGPGRSWPPTVAGRRVGRTVRPRSGPTGRWARWP